MHPLGVRGYDTGHFETTREGGWMTDSGLSDNFFDALNVSFDTNLEGPDWMVGPSDYSGIGYTWNPIQSGKALAYNIGQSLTNLASSPTDIFDGLNISGSYYFGHDVHNEEGLACRDFNGFPTSCYNPTNKMVQNKLDTPGTWHDTSKGPCAYGPCVYESDGGVKWHTYLGDYESLGLSGIGTNKWDELLGGDFDDYGDIEGIRHLGLGGAPEDGKMSTWLQELEERADAGDLSEEQMVKYQALKDEGFSFQQMRDFLDYDPAEYLGMKFSEKLDTTYDTTAEDFIRDTMQGKTGQTAKSAYDRFEGNLGSGDMTEQNFAKLVQASATFERMQDRDSIANLREAYATSMYDRIAEVARDDKAFNQSYFAILMSSPESWDLLEENTERQLEGADWSQYG